MTTTESQSPPPPLLAFGSVGELRGTEMFVKLAGRSTSRQPSRFEVPTVLLVNVREKIVD
jgi:hypothetical protein